MTGLTIVGRLERRSAGRQRLRRVSVPASEDPAVVSMSPASSSTTGPLVSRIARNLALSYKVDELIEQGVIRNLSHAASLLEITRARVTQIANLRFLPIALQEDVLLGRVKASERELREVLKDPVWPAARGTL